MPDSRIACRSPSPASRIAIAREPESAGGWTPVQPAIANPSPGSARKRPKRQCRGWWRVYRIRAYVARRPFSRVSEGIPVIGLPDSGSAGHRNPPGRSPVAGSRRWPNAIRAHGGMSVPESRRRRSWAIVEGLGGLSVPIIAYVVDRTIFAFGILLTKFLTNIPNSRIEICGRS